MNVNDANTRRDICSKRNSLKAATDSTLTKEQLAMQNHWTSVLVSWCNASPEDNEASDTSITIPKSGVSEQWMHEQKNVLEGKGYCVNVSGSSFKVSF